MPVCLWLWSTRSVVWWGLRTSADGKRPGEPVVILGGDPADVPLADASGELLADVIVAERIPAVFDLSGLSKVGARTASYRLVCLALKARPTRPGS